MWKQKPSTITVAIIRQKRNVSIEPKLNLDIFILTDGTNCYVRFFENRIDENIIRTFCRVFFRLCFSFSFVDGGFLKNIHLQLNKKNSTRKMSGNFSDECKRILFCSILHPLRILRPNMFMFNHPLILRSHIFVAWISVHIAFFMQNYTNNMSNVLTSAENAFNTKCSMQCV